LEALDQLRIRPKGKLGDATDRDKDLDKFLKNRDGKPWELAHPPKVILNKSTHLFQQIN